jgi:glycosyltransferase involved in cell wall biosynthesis
VSGPSAVTIVIPVHDGERFVVQAVLSALEQTVSTPVLVIDDGSTDATPALLARFGAAVATLRKPNGGTSSAWNLALASCDSEYVLGLDADDELEPSAAEDLLEVARGATGAGVVYSDYRLVDAAGAETREVRSLEPGEPLGPLRRLHDQIEQTDLQFPFGHARLYRRDVLLNHGGFDERYRYAEDYELLLRLAARGVAFARCPRTLYRYRWHDRNKGVVARAEQVAEVRRAVRELAA